MSHFLGGRRGSLAQIDSDSQGMGLRRSKPPGSARLKETTNAALSPALRRPNNPFRNKLLEKQVQLLVQKIDAKLPCNSGLSLSTIENDGVVNKAVDGFFELAVTNPDLVVHPLCVLLEELHKRKLPDGQYPEDVLDSQLFIIKIITRALDARWPGMPVNPASTPSAYHCQENSIHQESNSQKHSLIKIDPSIPPQPSTTSLQSNVSSASWLEPFPLDEALVVYALDIIYSALPDLLSPNMEDRFPWNIVAWEPMPPRPTRVKRSDANLDAELASTRSLIDSGCFNRYTVYSHDHVRDEELHGSYFVSVPILMRRYMGRIIYNLCASNWPVVFAHFQKRLSSMAHKEKVATPGPILHLQDPLQSLRKSMHPPQSKPQVAIFQKMTKSTPDLVAEHMPHQELILLTFGMIDQYISLYDGMSASTQEAASLGLRTVIINWAESFPEEFKELWATHVVHRRTLISGQRPEDETNRRFLEGIPERALDLLRERTKTSDRRTPSFNPALAALLSISPSRCDAAIEVAEGNKKATKANNFLKLMAHYLTTGSPALSISQQASYAYLDLIRFSYMIPPATPDHAEPSLRRIGKSLAADLLNFTIKGGSAGRPFFASPDPIDVNYYAYCQAALFRFHPEHTLTSLMKVCLEPGRSYAVMLSVVKALILLVVESCLCSVPEVVDGKTFTPSPVPICNKLAIAKKNNPTLAEVIDEEARLLIHIQTLNPLHQGFWLYGTTDEDHKLLIQQTSLAPKKFATDQRALLMADMALGASVTRCLNIPPGGEFYDEALRFLYFTMPAAVASISRRMLSVLDDCKLKYITQNCLQTLVTQLVECSPYSQDDGWRFSTLLLPLLDLMELAIWLGVSSPDRDLSLSSQRCLRLLCLFRRHPKAGKPVYFTDAQFTSRCLMLEGLSAHHELITGRVAFQKSLRKQLSGIPISPIEIMSFRVGVARYFTLLPRVALSSAEHNSRSRRDKEADFFEWQNILRLLCGSLSTDLVDSSLSFPSDLVHLLPLPLQGPYQAAEVAHQFMSDTVPLLGTDNARVRQAVRDALGMDLHQRAMPLLLEFYHRLRFDATLSNGCIGSSGDVHTAALRLFVLCVEKMHVQELNPHLMSGRDSLQPVSQKTHRFIALLLKMLPNHETLPSGPVSKWDPKIAVMCNDSNLLYELILSGIAHLLNNNAEACKGICLSHCYDASIELRVIFMTAFTRVLRFGTKLQSVEKSATSNKQDALCQIISEVVVEVCPSTEVEVIVPALTRIFDTPKPLLDFLKTVIEHEIANTPFGRYHGYQYLRYITQYVVHEMEQIPKGRSFEVDPVYLPFGEDINANAEALVSVTQKLIETLKASTNSIPRVVKEMCRYISEAVSKAWPDISNSKSFRRGLVHVTKILQSISNQISFGRDAPSAINLFIEENVNVALIGGESFPGNYDGTDSLVLHQFLQRHSEAIRARLMDVKRVTIADDDAPRRQACESLYIMLAETRPALDMPKLTSNTMAHHQVYQQVMARNIGRNTDGVKEIFTSWSEADHPLFVFSFSKLNTDLVDLELLLYYMFKARLIIISESQADTLDFDIVFDFTAFLCRTSFPIPWLKLAIELLPLDIRQRWRTAYILNMNTSSQHFLRKVYAQCHIGMQVADRMIIISSIAELQEHLPHVPSIVNNILSASLEKSLYAEEFQPVHYQIENNPWSSAVVHVSSEHLRIASIVPHEIFLKWKAHITDVFLLQDMDDIYMGENDTQIIIRLTNSGPIIRLEFPARDNLLMAIKNAKVAALLAIGLLHACHPIDRVRGSAHEMLAAICTYLGQLYSVERYSFGGELESKSFNICSTDHSRLYFGMVDWFFECGNGSADQLSPMSITLDQKSETVCSVIQRNIWKEIGKQPVTVISVVLDELLAIALSDGPDSSKGDLIADILISLSTIQAQSKILRELRTYLIRACSMPLRTLTDAEQWNSIITLARLSMIAGHSTQMVIQSQMCAPEVAYAITMMIGIGPLSVRLTVYAMATNLLQALHAAQAEEGGNIGQLRNLIEEMEGAESQALFGLIKKYPTCPCTLLDDTSNRITVQSLEKITDILSRALHLGTPSVDTRNVWHARWMSLACFTAFHPSPYGQFRGFTVIGRLCNSNMDEEFLRNTIDMFMRNIKSGKPDSEASASIIRCLHLFMLKSSPSPKYSATLFWLAIAILQSEYTRLRSEALCLVEACLETLKRQRVSEEWNSTQFESIIKLLMDAREPLRSASNELDSLSGLSFDANFGFALIGTLWYDVRARDEVLIVKNILTSLLAVVYQETNNGVGPKPTTLNSLTMPLFVGLAHCFDKTSYKNLLKKYCDFNELPHRDSSPPGEVDDWSINFEALGISDGITAHLTSAFILAQNNRIILTEERENMGLMFGLLARVHPEQFGSALWHHMELVSMDHFFHNPIASDAYIKAISMTFDLLMAVADRSKPNSSSRKSNVDEVLANVGLHGLLAPFRRIHCITETDEDIVKKKKEVSKYISELIGLIQDSVRH
ncbi:hypothetical protein BU17DRAFT_64094 [Hysterangium stoloniferum]|nr:hypothetical protein BU17DRAFT_64094 [Hysterangium stoloniferum]